MHGIYKHLQLFLIFIAMFAGKRIFGPGLDILSRVQCEATQTLTQLTASEKGLPLT